MQQKLNGIPSYVRNDNIPSSMKKALVAVEDKRFYDHGAIDVLGLLRAGLVNLYSQDTVEGGSTISQQVVKNVFLTQERTFSRKLKELYLASYWNETTVKTPFLPLILIRPISVPMRTESPRPVEFITAFPLKA